MHCVADSTCPASAYPAGVVDATRTPGTAQPPDPAARPPSTAAAPARSGSAGLVALVAVLLAAVAARPLLAGLIDRPAVANAATIFVAIAVQAMPFLVLGVSVSAAIAAFVPPAAIARLMPRDPVLAVGVAAVAGAALPGCECGSVPIARRLIARGVTPAAALTFLLSAPAVNPVVLVSTAVAFPGQPRMVVGRLVASLLASVTVGLLWTALGRDALAGLTGRAGRDRPTIGSRAAVFTATAAHDFLSAGGFLVIGSAAAALVQTVVPRTVVDAFTSPGWVAVPALALFAVLLSICSEADAFVAASLRQFPLTARLAFLVVGPMVDLKLIALQAGTFGRSFALRFAPLTFVCALSSASLVGWWLW